MEPATVYSSHTMLSSEIQCVAEGSTDEKRTSETEPILITQIATYGKRCCFLSVFSPRGATCV